MRLLIVTQVVDQHDPILGFFHRWITEYARACEHVYVLCLREGTHALPKNVTVLSLGKEKGYRRLSYLRLFFSYIWKYRREYDAVFVHMNQIYVVLGGLLWRLWGKHIGLWYAHGATSLSLRIATFLTHHVFTSTASGFRLKSRKVRIVGQGIDTELFPRCSDTYDASRIRVVCVGRIGPIKRNEILIDAIAYLRGRGIDATATFVGETIDRSYHSSLRTQIAGKNLESAVSFTGAVSPEEVSAYICEADVFANPSATGSLDKVGLEALVSGVPVVTSNPAFREVLGIYAERLMFPSDDAEALADRITVLHTAPDRRELIEALSEMVRKKHSVEALIPRILAHYTTI